MRGTMRRMTVGLALGGALVLGAAGSAGAAHNGNNFADLEGSGGADGHAVVNYSEGRGTFNASVNVSGLEDGTYTLQVVSPNGQTATTICTYHTTAGRDGCSATDLALPGFGSAQIVEADENVVASGTFERRGNCRDADQMGSQCEANDAPGRNK